MSLLRVSKTSFSGESNLLHGHYLLKTLTRLTLARNLLLDKYMEGAAAIIISEHRDSVSNSA